MPLHNILGPIPIPPAGDYELDFVGAFQSIQVRPQIRLALAAVGALQIHDNVDAWVDRFNRNGTAGFEQHRPSRVAEFGHQGDGIGLQ